MRSNRTYVAYAITYLFVNSRDKRIITTDGEKPSARAYVTNEYDNLFTRNLFVVITRDRFFKNTKRIALPNTDVIYHVLQFETLGTT